MLFLTGVIMLLILVFAVDAAQKRSSFLDNDKSK
jgi:hypothetical protein